MIVGLALVAGTPRVWAQQSAAQPANTGSESAREWFERGLRALDGRRFDDAIRAFERSYALRPSPVVTYNLGLALRGTGRLREAIASLERFVAQPTTGTSPAQLAAVRDEIARMRAALATVVIDVTPRGARVVIDAGEALVTSGAAQIDPGTHTVSLSLDGYRSETRLLTASRGRSTELRVALEPSDRGPRLQIEPDVASASVLVDGVELGRGSVGAPVSAGVHTVIVRAAGYREARREVRVSSDGVTRVSFAMQRDAGLRPWVIGVIAGSAAVGAVLIVGIAVSVRPEPRAYEPPPRTNPGWLGNTLEMSAR